MRHDAVAHFNKVLSQIGEPRQCPKCFTKLKKNVEDAADSGAHLITATYTCPNCGDEISKEGWRLTECTNQKEKERKQ